MINAWSVFTFLSITECDGYCTLQNWKFLLNKSYDLLTCIRTFAMLLVSSTSIAVSWVFPLVKAGYAVWLAQSLQILQCKILDLQVQHRLVVVSAVSHCAQ